MCHGDPREVWRQAPRPGLTAYRTPWSSQLTDSSTVGGPNLDVDHLVADAFVEVLEGSRREIPVVLEDGSGPPFLFRRQDPGNPFDERATRLAAQGRHRNADARIV